MVGRSCNRTHLARYRARVRRGGSGECRKAPAETSLGPVGYVTVAAGAVTVGAAVVLMVVLPP